MYRKYRPSSRSPVPMTPKKSPRRSGGVVSPRRTPPSLPTPMSAGWNYVPSSPSANRIKKKPTKKSPKARKMSPTRGKRGVALFADNQTRTGRMRTVSPKRK